MKPERRTKNLMTLLGWQGGTVHDACKEVGLEVNDFLYSESPFAMHKPSLNFQRGYAEASDIALYLSANKGNLDYWLGAISAIENERHKAMEEDFKS